MTKESHEITRPAFNLDQEKNLVSFSFLGGRAVRAATVIPLTRAKVTLTAMRALDMPSDEVEQLTGIAEGKAKRWSVGIHRVLGAPNILAAFAVCVSREIILINTPAPRENLRLTPDELEIAYHLSLGVPPMKISDIMGKHYTWRKEREDEAMERNGITGRGQLVAGAILTRQLVPKTDASLAHSIHMHWADQGAGSSN